MIEPGDASTFVFIDVADFALHPDGADWRADSHELLERWWNDAHALTAATDAELLRDGGNWRLFHHEDPITAVQIARRVVDMWADDWTHGFPLARAGVHTGDVNAYEAGMVVAETHLAGPGLATAARVTARAPAGEVLVTTATRRHLTGSGIQLAKGVEVVILNPFRTKMKLYAVTSLEPVPGRPHAQTSPDVGRVERISDPPEADVTDLLYGFGEVTMVFAPRNVVEEIRATRHALSTCETWGDLRRRISQTRWAELRADLLAAIQMQPPDDEELDVSELHEDVDWPHVHHHDMLYWIPEHVILELGNYYSTMTDEGVNFDAFDKDEIVEALAQEGVRCSYDLDLDDIFGSSNY